MPVRDSGSKCRNEFSIGTEGKRSDTIVIA